MYRLFFLLILCPFLYSQDLGKILWGEKPLTSPINFDYILAESKNKNDINFSGSFYINPYPKGVGYDVIRDEKTFKNRKNEDLFLKFPDFRVDLSIQGQNVIVYNKKIIDTDDKFWDLSFSDGMAWSREDHVYVTAPFTLIQKHANCSHNGVLLFALNSLNEISRSIFQISSETCAYFQFNYVAIFDSFFETNDNDNKFITKTQNNKSIDDLYEKYPSIFKGSFADSDAFNADEVTAYGFFDGEEHFIGPCLTRSGNYPFCDNLLLPAYSLTKTIGGTLGIAAYQKKYGSIVDIKINDLVSACSKNKWKDITIENLSDMATGQYKSLVHYGDEDSLASVNFIFNNLSHEEKVDFSCNNYPKKKNPGTTFVYHTSDTYLIGTSLNNLLSDKKENDFFDDLLVPIFNHHNFSEKIKYIRRTNDIRNQPYTGWGMFLQRDDLIKLNSLLQSPERIKYFSKEFLDEGLQRTEDKGLLAIKQSDIFYNNGFWAARFDKNIFGCKEDLMIPFMSGFGGITVVFLPNSMMYYYFSDNFTFSWYSAVYAAHNIKPLC